MYLVSKYINQNYNFDKIAHNGQKKTNNLTPKKLKKE